MPDLLHHLPAHRVYTDIGPRVLAVDNDEPRAFRLPREVNNGYIHLEHLRRNVLFVNPEDLEIVELLRSLALAESLNHHTEVIATFLPIYLARVDVEEVLLSHHRA